MEIKKVWERKDGIKFIVIPKSSNIQKGDYVQVSKLEVNEYGGKENNEDY